MSGEGAESWEQLKLEELKISEPVANGEAAAPVAAPAGAPQVPAPAQQDNKPGVSATRWVSLHRRNAALTLLA